MVELSNLNTGSEARPQVRPLRANNLIAVASGKGGVGKTWFSITLASALAKRGRKVLLFDGDLGLANVDIQLGLTPKRDLGEFITGDSTLASVVHNYAEGGFSIIAGRSGMGSLATLPSQKLADLRTDLIALAASYDDVIVDLGAGIDKTVRHLAGPAGMTLVVTNEEPTALTDAYAFIKVVHGAVPSMEMGVVVNLATDPKEGERTYNTLSKACQNFLKYNPALAGIVRRDPRVPQSIRQQQPLMMNWPGTDAAQDVDAIALKLTRRQQRREA
jgi:flagellar biosynthesis protein FlhG